MKKWQKAVLEHGWKHRTTIVDEKTLFIKGFTGDSNGNDIHVILTRNNDNTYTEITSDGITTKFDSIRDWLGY